MLAGTAVFALRILQILALVPTRGILGFFIDQYNDSPTKIPTGILYPFVVTILATVWTLIARVMLYGRRYPEQLVEIIDVCFLVLLTAAVVLLAPWAQGTDRAEGVWGWGYVNAAWQKQCTMLKAAWALGIIDVILFFAVFVAASIWKNGRAVTYPGRSRVRHIQGVMTRLEIRSLYFCSERFEAFL